MITAPFHYETRIGSTGITLAPPEAGPFEVAGVVEEQDTGLILDLDPVVSDTQESYESLIRQMQEQIPHIPGEVLVRKGSPVRFLAIVHDINRKPSWKEEWIEIALENLFRKIEQYRIDTVCMPLLGTVHGSMQEENFIRLLITTLSRKQSIYPEKIWLIVEDTVFSRVRDVIDNIV